MKAKKLSLAMMLAGAVFMLATFIIAWITGGALPTGDEVGGIIKLGVAIAVMGSPVSFSTWLEKITGKDDTGGEV